MNKFAISSAGLGDAFKRSASSLVEANNSMEQASGLIVGANDVAQDPDAVGTMWKTVAMRIRGAKTELEEAGEDTEGLVESTSQLQAMIKRMTGFDILEKDQQTFKSTYDIIVGIGEQYQKLSDIDQASLLEALAGKRQGNMLASALNNIEDIKKAYETASNSAGSAQKEQDKWMESIEAKTKQFGATFEKVSQQVVDSNFIKGTVDTGTGLLGAVSWLIDKLGTIPTLATAAYAALSGIKNAGKENSFEYALPFLEAA